MMIKATQYTREDGCTIHYNKFRDAWHLTCNPGGPSYMWDEENCKWTCVALPECSSGDQQRFAMSYPVAMERLQTVHHVALEMSSRKIML